MLYSEHVCSNWAGFWSKISSEVDFINVLYHAKLKRHCKPKQTHPGGFHLLFLPVLTEIKPRAKGGVSPSWIDTLTFDTVELNLTGTLRSGKHLQDKHKVLLWWKALMTWHRYWGILLANTTVTKQNIVATELTNTVNICFPTSSCERPFYGWAVAMRTSSASGRTPAGDSGWCTCWLLLSHRYLPTSPSKTGQTFLTL